MQKSNITQMGWAFAAQAIGAANAVRASTEYLASVEDAIKQLEDAINNDRYRNVPANTFQGYVFEDYSAETFNIDAVASGSKDRAVVLKKNDLGSVDVKLDSGKEYSLKSYATAEESVKNQARMNPKTRQPLYKNQDRVVPTEQLNQARQVASEQAAKEQVNRPDVAESYRETSERLTDRIENDEGVSSKPITRKELDKIASEAKKQEFKAEEHDITPETVIKAEYMLKEAGKAGLTSAAITMALQLAPAIIESIDYLFRTGEIDTRKLKSTGILAISAGGESFLRGSVAYVLSLAIQEGKLGVLKNLNSTLVGMLVAVTIEIVKDSIMVSMGKILVSGGQTTVANLFYNMSKRTIGLVGLWDCVAFDEVAGINFKDKDGIQIMKDYMASGSFARGKEEKAASASMVFVGNINQSVDVLLKTSSLFDPFPPEMGTDTAFLDRMHCYIPGWEIPKFRPEHFTDDYGFITDYLAEFMRELRKEQYGDALDRWFRLGKNLNQRDTIAVRKMVGGLVKLLYPNGEYTKEELEEILVLALEMRRRVKEQLKKLGGMEFYDVNFSYIDNETFEERFVSVPEQGGGKLIPEGLCNPGQVYTVSRGKSGMIGVFRLESQMLPGNGKFERTGIGVDRDARESSNTAFNYLKANGNRISGSISTTTKDYIINYQDLQGIGMTGKLALPSLIALCSIALGRPTLGSLAVLGEISISGTMIKVDELANTLQCCLDSGAKKVLIPSVSMIDFATVPADLMGAFQLIPYSSAEDAVFKALGVE